MSSLIRDVLNAVMCESKNSDYRSCAEALTIPVISAMLGDPDCTENFFTLKEVRKSLNRFEVTLVDKFYYTKRSFDIPMSIIDAEDPIDAATLWRLDCRVSDAGANLRRANAEAQAARCTFENAIKERDDYITAHGQPSNDE